jgi:hypothetical protein
MSMDQDQKVNAKKITMLVEEEGRGRETHFLLY